MTVTQSASTARLYSYRDASVMWPPLSATKKPGKRKPLYFYSRGVWLNPPGVSERALKDRTLTYSTVKRCPNVLASNAIAMRGSSVSHHPTIQCSSGAKHSVTFTSQRLSPRFARASYVTSRTCCRSASSFLPNTPHTMLLMPHRCVMTIPKLYRANPIACR